MSSKLVTRTREQDGRFALRLESKAACKRDAKNTQQIAERRAQVEEENREWALEHDIDPADLSFLFA